MDSERTRRRFLHAVSAGAIATLAGCSGSSGDVGDGTRELLSNSVLYSSPTCVCCEQYAAHVEDRDIPLDVRKTRDLESVKTEMGVPRDLWACHTVATEEYVVEGHVPLAAVEKLVDERPSVAGIALPGMPNGSPGMGGTKQDEFVVHAFDSDGQYDVFTKI